MAIRYEQLPVFINLGGCAAAGTNPVMATTFTAGENRPLSPVRALGYNGAVSVAATGPIEGTFSVTYVLHGNSDYSAGCGDPTAASEVPDGRCALQQPFDTALAANTQVTVAGENLFNQGYCTTYTIAAEPNSVVNATLAGNFYDSAGMIPAGGGMAGAAPLEAGGATDVGHGSNVNVDPALFGFNVNAFSANYEASRGVNPIYALGDTSAVIVIPTDPQESLTLQGDDIPTQAASSVAAVACLEAINANFTVNTACDDNIETLALCGYVTSRDIEIAENDVLRGNITIVDHNLPQNF